MKYWMMFFSLLSRTVLALQLGAPFSDHMVLQCDKPIPVWGKADPGETVTVSFASQNKTTLANDNGEWRVRLDPMPASFEPRKLNVYCNHQSAIIPKRSAENFPEGNSDEGAVYRQCSDVLVGEVWHCSGQSNMGRRLNATDDAEKYAAQADLPHIRYAEVPLTASDTPQDDVAMPWQVWTSNSVMRLSGTAFHFGRKLSEEINKPIGLIYCAWGGSKIQAWIPEDYFQNDPAYEAGMTRLKRNENDLAQRMADWKSGGQQGPKPKGNHTDDRHRPCLLDNAMVHPIQPFPIRGVIWYQGESDAGIPNEYRSLFKSLVQSWRDRWNDPALPVYYVQLPNFIKESPPWEEFRKMQLGLLNEMDHVGMAVTIDIGDPHDIHPGNKYDVGERLGRLALHHTYGREDICPSGPLPASVKRVGGNAVVTWKWAWNGLKTSDGAPNVKGFMLAGETGPYKPATARITGKNTVEVQADGIESPAKIRYGFEDNPTVNLVNSENLPATPFLKYF